MTERQFRSRDQKQGYKNDREERRERQPNRREDGESDRRERPFNQRENTEDGYTRDRDQKDQRQGRRDEEGRRDEGRYRNSNTGDESASLASSTASVSHGQCVYFLQGTCNKGSNCKFSHATIETTPRPTTSVAPEAGSRICPFFLKGDCKKGNSCNFPHTATGITTATTTSTTLEAGSRICPFFLQGDCKKGNSCNFSHTTPPMTSTSGSLASSTATISSNPELSSRVCPFFLQGGCKKGNSCNLLHTKPTTTTTTATPSSLAASTASLPSTTTEPCVHFRRGNCFRGDKCHLSHQVDPCHERPPVPAPKTTYSAEIEDSQVKVEFGPGGEVLRIFDPIPFIRVKFGGFPPNFSEDKIRAFFEKFGEIEGSLKCRSSTEGGPVSGTFDYATLKGARLAVAEADGIEVCTEHSCRLRKCTTCEEGNKIYVSFSSPNKMDASSVVVKCASPTEKVDFEEFPEQIHKLASTKLLVVFNTPYSAAALVERGSDFFPNYTFRFDSEIIFPIPRAATEYMKTDLVQLIARLKNAMRNCTLDPSGRKVIIYGKDTRAAKTEIEKLISPYWIPVEVPSLLIGLNNMFDNWSKESSTKVFGGVGKVGIIGSETNKQVAIPLTVSFFEHPDNAPTEKIMDIAKYWNRELIRNTTSMGSNCGVYVSYNYRDRTVKFEGRASSVHAMEEKLREVLRTAKEVKPRAPHTAGNEEEEEEEEECPLCFGPLEDMKLLSACGHKYCSECLKHALTSAVEMKQFPICCVACNEMVPMKELRRNLPPDDFQKLIKFSYFKYLEDNQGKYMSCTYPGCNQCSPRTDNAFYRCVNCSQVHCTRCNVDYFQSQLSHEGLTCELYQKMYNSEAEGKEELRAWLLENTKICPSCHTRIEKNQGCNHMTCSRCRYQFCWICLAKWGTGCSYYSCRNKSA